MDRHELSEFGHHSGSMSSRSYAAEATGHYAGHQRIGGTYFLLARSRDDSAGTILNVGLSPHNKGRRELAEIDRKLREGAERMALNLLGIDTSK